MPHLIIGHTTDTTTRIWVRGDRTSTTCEVALSDGGGEKSQTLLLLSEHDYTGTTYFDALAPGAAYSVIAKFSPSGAKIHGRVRLIREVSHDGLEPFSFVLSSCNLSVVSINNFLALLATTAGTSLANSSLDLPVERWKAPPFLWLRSLLRLPLRIGFRLMAGAVIWFTRIKQPGAPYIRSPFLKLSAVFDASLVDLHPPPTQPMRSDDPQAVPYLAVGERVRSSSGATGVVASTQVVQEPVEQTAPPLIRSADHNASSSVRQLVLTQVKGLFKSGDSLFREVSSDSGAQELGKIRGCARARPWYSRPSFFLHAGDQIYYDFPNPDRAPARDQYRLAYREAWFEDKSLRHLLAHWPHYMTLDDHEIADQFATDFIVPKQGQDASEYLFHARAAYSEYAHALNPPRAQGQITTKCGPYWYTFDKGNTHFFVMDTRTRRRNRENPEIIDAEQMRELLKWMSEHREALKFVVTSVPFVAQVNEPASNQKKNWFKSNASPIEARGAATRAEEPVAEPAKRNSEHDKWSAQRFQRQRDRIIEHIANNGIERLVFLTGDMHCCYHATMRIGPAARKYQAITIHELAGGPVNQLQLANVNEFDRRCAKTTEGDAPVDYEVVLERFHGDVSAVMHVRVDYLQRDEVTSAGRRVVPEVEWNVIRTLTDPGPPGWSAQTNSPGDEAEASSGESVMAGRISFVRRRAVTGLHPW